MPDGSGINTPKPAQEAPVRALEGELIPAGAVIWIANGREAGSCCAARPRP